MTDTPTKPIGATINDHATIADLKAKKERQQSRTDIPTGAAASGVSETTSSYRGRGVALDTPKHARPDRAGKKLIAGYFSPEIQKALKHVGVDEGLTLQQIMAEAFVLYLTTKGRLPKY